ncbi:MAG TPA: cytochrome P460 family protein [Bryobacteraceae bacterium]|nr:cytochrome P460 family protein [Bryobacteraceae bacterium]
MTKLAALMAVAVVCLQGGDSAEFTSAGDLKYPANYREWVFLSSGLGMTYGPNAPAAGTRPRFDNVYVNPSAYRHFTRTGAWPDGTVMILEIRESESKGSINKHGHYQGQVAAIEAHVKDSKRFSTGWAFFDLSPRPEGPVKSVKAIAAGNGCEKCHAPNGAVDSTFVQFYPDLIAIAKKFGTYKEPAEQISAVH